MLYSLFAFITRFMKISVDVIR